MVGLIVLAVVVIYIAFWWFVVAKLKGGWAKTAAVLVALAIPLWDLPIGYLHFWRTCSELGGLHTGKGLRPTDSVLVERGYKPDELVRYGFKVIEYSAEGGVQRYTSGPAGLVKSVHSSPVSEIRINLVLNQRLPWNLLRHDVSASRIDTGEVVARHTNLHWRGLWWQVELSPLLGDGGSCYEINDVPVLTALVRGRGP